ncbi:MAG: M56 family metallopeptidase [Gemmatimonadaceae bacterium]
MFPLLPTPADSARAVAHVYSVSLLVSIPLVLALAAGLLARHLSAGARALVWKGTIGAIALILLERLLPVAWLSWSVPYGLAAPLIALGRLQLAGLPSGVPGGSVDAVWATTVWVVYVSGVALCLIPVLHATWTTQRTTRRAARLQDQRVAAQLRAARADLALRRGARCVVSPTATTPYTVGLVFPVIVLPVAALRWSDSELRAAFTHELAHVARWDVASTLAARIACAVLWFHPACWWVLRQMLRDSEHAVDDIVLSRGVRASDYASLLVRASDVRTDVQLAGRALGGGHGLRARLAAIVSTHRAAPTNWRHAACTAVLALVIALPIGAVRLSPTRDALTLLLRDGRWESRAYAAAGLAQRRDSVEVARAAARLDPNPRVRALARYALTQPGRDLPSLLAATP